MSDNQSPMAAFNGAGENEGLQIWRIENLEPVVWPSSEFGNFYSGDSFIVLSVRVSKTNRREYDIHFWLGEESSQDEKGAAAYATVTLDDRLGGAAVQHREVQGHESSRFMSYFKAQGGVKYLKGGIASGFNHVDHDAYESRLLQIKGKRDVRCAQVELSSAVMNQGDVFILDAGTTIYQWNGPDSNKYEKFAGLQMTTKIKNEERGGKPNLVFLEGGEDDDSGADAEAFWAALGDKSAVQSAEDGGSDDAALVVETKLFAISADAFTEVGTANKLSKDDLNTEGVFLLDAGSSVFVWIGKNADKALRKAGLVRAQAYLDENSRPAWCPMTRVVEQGEPPIFRSHFVKWVTQDDKSKAALAFAPAPYTKKDRSQEANVDVDALHTGTNQRRGSTLVRQQTGLNDKDDGSESIKMWRIENFQKVAVAPEQFGEFFSGDSYIVLRSFTVRGRPHWIIYFWQGRHSTADEKGASALLSVDMDEELGGDPVQVRVVQGQEPGHFLELFKGRMVVHDGGAASGFANRGESDQDTSESALRLYHIKGTDEVNTRAVAVKPQAASLNSGDCFIVLTTDEMFVWKGKGSNEDEQLFADTVGQRLGGERSVQSIEEGSESDDFWALLGGQAEYATSSELADQPREPRLFECTDASGTFRVSQIFDFVQEDLTQDDIFMLDVFTEVYVWVGRDSNQHEKDCAFKAALDYVSHAPDGRSKDTPVLRIEAGAEPPMFTSSFLGWDIDVAQQIADPYQLQLAALKTKSAQEAPLGTVQEEAGTQKATPAAPQRITADSIGFKDPATNKFTLEQLRAGAETWEQLQIDPSKREEYLAEDDFKGLFGVSLAEYKDMKGWKKKGLKQKSGLF